MKHTKEEKEDAEQLGKFLADQSKPVYIRSHSTPLKITPAEWMASDNGESITIWIDIEKP